MNRRAEAARPTQEMWDCEEEITDRVCSGVVHPTKKTAWAKSSTLRLRPKRAHPTDYRAT